MRSTKAHRERMSTRIPLETAHQFLAAFGITKATPAYERWVKDDGFDPDDFPSVLGDSPLVFTIDWRAALGDELVRIVDGLGRFHVELEFAMDPETSTGFVTCQGRHATVKYAPADNDDFKNVMLSIQGILPTAIEIRASPRNDDCDTWIFAALPHGE